MSEEVAYTGYVRLADPAKEESQGGHCMLAVGYFFDKSGCDYIIAQNSWGDSWGDKGFCYIPMGCFLRDTFDYWTIRSIENESSDISDKDYKPEPVAPPTPQVAPQVIPQVEPKLEPEPVPVVVPFPAIEPAPTVIVAPVESKSEISIGFIIAVIGTIILAALFFTTR
jgi:hypothetical protein